MSRWLRVRLVLDRVIAALLLIPCGPLIAALVVLVRRSDGPPALIAVPRVGRHGHQIRMWKLRSMRAESTGGRASGVALTREHDDRITPIGRRLRAHHLDELPQLYNVVRGQMGLLGPRPEAPEFVDLIDPRWRSVLESPPGIAGPTQLIIGDWERDRITACPLGTTYVDEVLPVKLAIDEWYVRRSSPLLDARVISTLVRRFLPGAGSCRLARQVHAAVPEANRVPS